MAFARGEDKAKVIITGAVCIVTRGIKLCVWAERNGSEKWSEMNHILVALWWT